jgi:ABC-type Mn2+/Zn2+ transport system permease subunit
VIVPAAMARQASNKPNGMGGWAATLGVAWVGWAVMQVLRRSGACFYPSTANGEVAL